MDTWLFNLLGSIFSGIGAVLNFLANNIHIFGWIFLIWLMLFWLKIMGGHKGGGYLTIAVFVIQTLILWRNLPVDGRLITILTRCIIPAIIALAIWGFSNNYPVGNFVLTLSSHAVMIILTNVFSNVLIPIVTAVVGIPLVLFFMWLFCS